MPLFGPPNIEALREKGDVGGLVKALRHKDAMVRADAAWVLWDLRDSGWDRFAFPENVQPWNLHGEAFTVRQIAPWALGEFGDERAVDPLIAAVMDRDVDLSRSAAEALGKLGDARAVEPLIAALKGPDDVVRRIAAEALGKLGDARAVEPLVGALKDRRLDVGASAAVALGKLGDARAVEGLVAALSVTDVGASAAVALAAIGGPEAEQALAEYRGRGR